MPVSEINQVTLARARFFVFDMSDCIGLLSVPKKRWISQNIATLSSVRDFIPLFFHPIHFPSFCFHLPFLGQRGEASDYRSWIASRVTSLIGGSLCESLGILLTFCFPTKPQRDSDLKSHFSGACPLTKVWISGANAKIAIFLSAKSISGQWIKEQSTIHDQRSKRNDQ
jgi:hypothetical protein